MKSVSQNYAPRFSSVVRSVLPCIPSQGRELASGARIGCHRFLWHGVIPLAFGGQGPGCSAKHSSVNRDKCPLPSRMIWPKMSMVLRLRNPDLAPLSHCIIALKLLGKKHHIRLSINFASYKVMCCSTLSLYKSVSELIDIKKTT